MQQTERPPSAQSLETAWRQLGYQPGYPPHVAPMTRAVDQSSARRRRCPSCKRAGMGCKPFHHGMSYRVLCVCPVCLVGEEA